MAGRDITEGRSTRAVAVDVGVIRTEVSPELEVFQEGKFCVRTTAEQVAAEEVFVQLRFRDGMAAAVLRAVGQAQGVQVAEVILAVAIGVQQVLPRVLGVVGIDRVNRPHIAGEEEGVDEGCV